MPLSSFGRVLAAIRICPLTATNKKPWLSQSVTGFASRRTATLPRTLPIRARRRGVSSPPFCAPLPGYGGHFRRVMAGLCASQHGHATGFAIALDDGQALVLD